MSRMDHILHLDETSLVVHAQAGLVAASLEEILSKRGLTIGDFPPAALGSTIGGLLAVRTPGKSSRRHGTIEEIVLGLSAVLPDGRSVHTRIAPRRASGPDLARALCGSEGTLGIITSAVLRIHRSPEVRLLASFCLPSMENAFAAIRLALREEASPAAMRVYNPLEAAMHLGHDQNETILVAATAGPTSLAACDRDLIRSAVEAVGGQAAGEELAQIWWRRRTGFAENLPEISPPNLQISATQSGLFGVYEAVRAAAEAKQCALRAHASRFAADGGVIFFTVSDEGGPLAEDSATLRALAEAGASAGGVPLGATSSGLGEYFERLRSTLDPKRRLNPNVLT
jgi:alkyldihydroxyacetonephosphate synthase